MRNKRHYRLILIALIFFVSVCGYGQQQKNDDLIKVFVGEFDEVGVESGYVNIAGDTIIPIGKYHYCYTDTLRNYAIVLRKQGGLIAIDKNDQELFEIFWFDNGPDPISEGLFRIKKNGKIGYANKYGEIIIVPQFDCAFPFKNGKAKVSNDCRIIPEDEHKRWESENWFYIDQTGKKMNLNALQQRVLCYP
ncbi:WG repeat-containing protein [Ancylomarina salipaludis]|uniref:WG repeat-containing protein n=1 Tax=Ancylomarina salipaludis TaxID=2501299 RepID=A0A4Q1JJC9_9BACT|nr:WG repeat-containing protein [Ancylomarina salipaludis]RXQ88493.1 WG repeat-containing protein [Ancylomarina salipaludis]